MTAQRIELDGIEILITRAEDGVLVVEIETPAEGPDVNHADGTPRMRVWINEALVHAEDGECHPIEYA